MLSAIIIFYIHQNFQNLISAMFLLHTILHIEHFSKSLRPAIIKASRKSDKQKGKNKHEITDFSS